MSGGTAKEGSPSIRVRVSVRVLFCRQGYETEVVEFLDMKGVGLALYKVHDRSIQPSRRYAQLTFDLTELQGTPRELGDF